MSTSIRPKPRPANIVAPNPTPAPEDAPTAETPQETVAPSPEPTPEPPREETTEAAPEDRGDIQRTEATEDTQETLGMQTSPRPKPRPNRQPPTPAATPPAETQEQRDARIASEVAAEERAREERENAEREERRRAERAAEAAAEAAAIAAASGQTGAGGQGTAPTGPPLNNGEIGDIRSAISSKWNVGSMGSGAMATTITIRVTFDQTGKPTNFELIEQSGPDANTAFATARRAIQRAYTENPGGIPLPPGKYETWRVLDFTFDPNGMRLR
jgi:hypothetical protein